jgi:hypothetical protein
MFLSWILSYQNLHMIALPGLIISILFLCRVTYSILAHFYLVYLSSKPPTLISPSFVSVPLRHIYTGILHTVVVFPLHDTIT